MEVNCRELPYNKTVEFRGDPNMDIGAFLHEVSCWFTKTQREECTELLPTALTFYYDHGCCGELDNIPMLIVSFEQGGTFNE